MSRLTCTCIIFLLLPQAVLSGEDGHHSNLAVVDGIAVTGVNDLLGSPIWPGLTAQLLGEYVPGAEEPLRITPDTSHDAVLATHYPQELLDLFGLVPGENYPDNGDNIPLHANPVPVAFSIYNRIPAVPASVATATQPARRDENPITLGNWLGAEGKAFIYCSVDGSRATVLMLFRGLVANGLYTLWAVPADETILPVAFGGVPNIVTADGHGGAIAHRNVAYCPTDGELGNITLAYHSDGMVYGNFPDVTFDGYISGIVTHDHVVFLLQ